MFEKHNTPAKLWGCMEAMNEVADDVMRSFADDALSPDEREDKIELVYSCIEKITNRIAAETEGERDPSEITYSEISCEYELYHA